MKRAQPAVADRPAKSPRRNRRVEPAVVATLAITGEMTIYRAAELRQAMAEHMARGGLRFNLAQVTEFDSAGLQLLAAAASGAARAGARIEVLDPPACVQEVFDLCGLQGDLTPRKELQ